MAIIQTPPSPSSEKVNFDTYLYMDGRKFYNNESSCYVLPSDSIEVKRSNFAHELYKRRWDGNFSSPIEEKLQSAEGGKVLDCGCGSGIWSYEMAVKYPNSTFIGLDIVPLFSRISNNEIKPLNLGFLEHDICNGIPFQDATFDYIFQRSMLISLKKSQWNMLLTEFARTLKPGGWVELMELQINEAVLTKTAKIFQKALNKHLEMNNHYQYRDFPFFDLLRSTNQFNSIKMIQKKVSVGSWGGEFGSKVADVLIEVYNGIKPSMKKIMNLTDLEYNELLRKLSKEVNDPLNDCMYITTIRVIAMKNPK